MRQPYLCSLDQLHMSTYCFADDGVIPNHSSFPMLVYSQVVRAAGDDPAAVAERCFAANGWGGTWRNGIFGFPHYHSHAHEVLAICRGSAQVLFGGKMGILLTVQAGDVVVLPAGTGHQRLSPSGDLLVVGAYPPGQIVDLCRGEVGERPQVIKNIQRVPLPPTDPVYGKQGPLLQHWHSHQSVCT